MNTKLFINNQFVETKHKLPVIDPSTNEIITEVSCASYEQVEMALEAARTAADTGPWPKLSLQERKEYLIKISQASLDNASEFARLETLNTGKPIKESTFMDVPSSAAVFAEMAQMLEQAMAAESLEISTDISQAQVQLNREPLGVAVLIVPWNYPLLIACWKMASALAAGNTIVLKPSSLTPLTALELAATIQKCGLPAGVVNIVAGSGDAIGKALCSDPRVDLISFTGSNEVGRKMFEYSSVHVKKLLMELGGKSAAIVCKDADVETAASSLLCGIFLNQGQMCTAMSRIFIEEPVYNTFMKAFVDKAKKIAIGPGADFQAQMGPLISDAQRKKVLGFIEEAVKQGANIVCGGKIPDDKKFSEGFFFEPAVLADVTPTMDIFKQEVFGPVACVKKFSSLAEAVILANASDFALAASIWTKDEKKARSLSGQLHAGAIWVNTYGMFYPQVPYGGFKQSGFGKELGHEGLLEYTRLKSVIMDKSGDGKPLVSHWYGL